VQSIADRFTALNPYDRKIVKGSILNITDANFVDKDPKKPQRQLYGYSIAAKRYALYERNKKDIKIIDPKAHGIGFLYPPKDSPKDWKEEVPEWIYEAWDYILRGALKLKRKAPSWLNLPQMMRLTITTYNVLKMLGEWPLARPFNFLMLPMVSPTFGYAFYKRATDRVLLVTQFLSKQDQWSGMKCVNIHSGKAYRMVCTNEKNPPYNVVFPKHFAELLIRYQEHPEAKSLAPNGGPCEADTSGLLQRAHVIAGELRYIGKETDRKWEEGEDISIFEFKTTEWGRAKKVEAPSELRDKTCKLSLRELVRRTGMSRHTILKVRRGEITRRSTLAHIAKSLNFTEGK